MFRSTGLTGWERTAVVADAAQDAPTAAVDDAPANSTPAAEMAAFKALTLDLARTLQQLQGRLDALEVTTVADCDRPSRDG